jgi:hypothetical protein
MVRICAIYRHPVPVIATFDNLSSLQNQPEQVLPAIFDIVCGKKKAF